VNPLFILGWTTLLYKR